MSANKHDPRLCMADPCRCPCSECPAGAMRLCARRAMHYLRRIEAVLDEHDSGDGVARWGGDALMSDIRRVLSEGGDET